MWKQLLAQRITCYNEQWYCYLCNSPQLDLDKAKNHLQETHLEQISTTNQILEFLEKSDISNKQCNKLLYNGVVLQNLPHDYFCIICQCHISTLSHVYEHVKDKKHAKKTYKTANIKKESLITVQQNLSRKQNLTDETIIKLVEQLDNLAIVEPTFVSLDQLTKSSNVNDNNLISDCIKLNKGLNGQDYFCIVCKCWIPTLSHVHEHVKGKNHQIHKSTSTTKKKLQNNSKSSNNNRDNSISILEAVSTSGTQTLICSMNTSTNTSLMERNVSKTRELQCIDNVHFPVTAANISNQDITLLQDKKITSDLFIPSNISKEINKSLNTMCLLKTTVQQKRTALERYNRMYRIEYLRFEKIMFSCREWKLSEIKKNLKFYIPCTNQNVICFICNVTHSSCDIQVWYKHISCNMHKNELNLLKEKSILLKQLMSKESTNIICHACSTKIDQDMINIHINEASHKMNRNKLLTQFKSSNYYYKLLIETSDPLCYAIQYFACVPCQKRFKMKVEFMDHLYKEHMFVILNNSCKEFGFCVICAILWYENKNYYLKHCSHPIHLYLKKSNDFAIKPLPKKVTKLLKHINKNVAALLKASEDISLESNQIISDLRSTLKSHHFSTIPIHIYGSRYTGLALSNSDIDIYLDFGSECTEAELIKSRSKQIAECLRVNWKVWKIIEILENTRTPIIKLVHISTGINCDISYMNGLSVKNSKFIRSFNNAYLPCRKLILFLKKWMQLCNFSGLEKITNYALVWLVIFYLQVEHGIPSVASLIKRHKEMEIISGWQTGVSHTFTINVPELPVHELLLGFFKYYGEFDYMNFVICPLLGNKCDKQLFTSLDKISTFSEDMKPYVTQLQGVNPEFFRIDSAMCVQDPFVLSLNVTRAIQVLTLRNFKEYCKESASILREITLC